jgi:hypothetical protein
MGKQLPPDQMRLYRHVDEVGVVMNALRIGWAPVAVIATHALLAAAIGHRRQLDPLFHFFGGSAGALAVWQAVSTEPGWLPQALARHRGRTALASVTVSALLWEAGEFAADRLFDVGAQAGWGDTSMISRSGSPGRPSWH